MNAGDYDIIPSAAVISGGGAGNYDITYSNGELTIDRQEITVTPNADQAKALGADDPTPFTYTLSSTVAVTGALGRSSGNDAGSYDFTLDTLSATSGNYELVLATSSPKFTITKQAVTVTSNDRTKAFGEADPELTFTVTSGVSLSGSLSREVGENVGQYDITIGDLVDRNPNYTITFSAATFEITKATVTVTPVSGQKKTYGSSDPTLTYTAEPDITLTGDLARDSGETVEMYDILQGTVTSNANYDITFTAGVQFAIGKEGADHHS